MKDALRLSTGASIAHARGLTGRGVNVGILDTKIEPGYAALSGRIASETDYTGKPPESDGATPSGHANIMASLIGGIGSGNFQTGMAPGASMHVARVCTSEGCLSTSIGAAATDLASKGVRLFNLSLGQQGELMAALAYRSLGQAILSVDGLAVVAAGNSSPNSPKSPDLPAALPNFSNRSDYFPSPMDLTRNWLAVVNVTLNASGQADALSTSSNQCGTSADYCLAAPGQLTINPLPGTSFKTSTLVNGTSSSAAVVTGAAALVWEAFPWMSASQIQQTLLTTATDIGAPGVDSVYGWGLVNAGRATNGPAQFTSDFIATIPSGGTARFGNIISGSGGLIKRGAGTLHLDAYNEFEGPTSVLDGRLQLSGSTKSGLSVSAGAQFEALNAQIGGGYRAHTGSTTIISVGTPLRVAGDAYLGGTLHLTAPNPLHTTLSAEPVIQANSITGTFQQLSYANDLFWSATLEYQPKQVIAQLTRTSATTSSIALNMPEAVQKGASVADAMVDAVHQLPANSDYAAPVPVVIARTSDLLMSEQTETESSIASLSAPLLSLDRQIAASRELEVQHEAANRLAWAGTTERNVWFGGSGSSGRRHLAGWQDAKWDIDGLQAGLTLPLADSPHILMLAADSNRLTLRARQNDRTRSDQRRFVGGYSNGSEPLNWSLLVGGSTRSTRLWREITLGLENERLDSERDDWSAILRLESQWTRHPRLRPYLAAGLLHEHAGSMSEEGANGVGLSLESNSRNLPFVEGGIRYRWNKNRWSLAADAAATHVLSGEELQFPARFSGLPGNAFQLDGFPMGTTQWRAGLQAAYRLGPTFRIHAATSLGKESGQPYTKAGYLGGEWAF